MKKLMLLVPLLFLLAGCRTGADAPVAATAVTQIPTEVTEPVTTVQTTAEPVTEPPVLLELNATEITLSEIGERATIYSGEIPAEDIFWYSADPAVAAVDRGVVTAMGLAGASNIYGVYGDQTVLCTVTSTAAYKSDRAPVLTPPDYECVDASFFSDAVFVGDSISLTLSHRHNGGLGDAQFLVQSNYSIYSAVNDLMYTSYRGRKYKNLEDAIAASGAQKVFIMLGTNDLGIFGVDQTLENMRTLIGLIREACPNIEIYLQSMTPIWSGASKEKLTNGNIRDYNFVLQFLAEELECGYINISPYLQDSTGGLAKVYSSDQYVHITEDGVAVWVSVLRAYGNYDGIAK